MTMGDENVKKALQQLCKCMQEFLYISFLN